MEMEEPTLQNHCLFCEPGIFNQGRQVILRSDNFYLFAGLGPIIEGYIIITPYKCGNVRFPFHSFADMSPELLDEFMFLRDVIARFYKENYKTPGGGLHFEHGLSGNTVINVKHSHHPHLCCYPGSIPLWENITDLPVYNIEGFCDLQAKVQGNSYLFMQNCFVDKSQKENSTKRETWESRLIVLADDAKIESQFFRRTLANFIGKDEWWNWTKFPQTDLVDKLVREFRLWIKNRTDLYKIEPEDDGIYRMSFLDSVFQLNTKGNNTAAPTYFNKWKGLEQYTVIGRFLRHLKQYPVDDDRPVRPKILDAGCGPGTYLKVFGDLGLECIGIDLSKGMLGIAAAFTHSEIVSRQEEKISGKEYPFPKLYEMSIIQPDLPSEYFDGIWCSAVFVHLPKIKAYDTLKSFYDLLKNGGILYLSAQSGGDPIIRFEGRMYVYYSREELKNLIAKCGFHIIEEWHEIVETGTFGDNTKKEWNHYIMKKELTLIDLGERKVLEHIKQLIPVIKKDNIYVDIGDDCAAIEPIPGELIVVTTDPCPKPVITYFEDVDYSHYGWFTMIINISDLGAMGAKPLGIILALEGPDEMGVAQLDQFYKGALEAAEKFDCPIIGGNIKDAPNFNCVGTALGSVRPDRMLKRDNARPGDLLVVLGGMGNFWAGVIYKLNTITLSPEESEKILGNLKRPIPRIKEGKILSANNLSKCAMDCSDGLIACFYELAKQSNVDIHIDISNIEPDPIVKKIADMVHIDVRKLMLAWGDWQLVCTIPADNLAKVKELMIKQDCPVNVVGTIAPGAGKVWFHDKDNLGELNYIASERFSKASYFSHGLKNYFALMQHEPLYK